MERILYCVARGRPEFGEMALGLARSLSLIGDTTPRVLVTDLQGYAWDRHFDRVIPPSGPRSALDKLLACETTEAQRILSLDVDMLAFKRMDEILAYCAGRPFAVQGYWDGEGSFHGRPVSEVCSAYDLKDGRFPRFNGGMAYYERGPVWKRLLARMKAAEADYAPLGFETFRRGYASEEVCMLHAMLTEGHVDLIPMETQFQHSMSGLLGPLHLDVTRNLCEAVCKSDHLEFARPHIFHAWRYKDYTVYWNELRKLRELEERADRQPREYVPRLARLRRSVERRWVERVRRWR